jgi:3-hydroxybutyryl-CoA dehydratase
MRYDELFVGQTAEYSKTVTDADVHAFAQLTGDVNPIHIDEEVARKTRFGGRIAHGMISAGLISAAIANKLPGGGAIYLAQTLKFTAPVRIGDTVTVSLKVLELLSKKRLRLETICRNQRGETVIEGEGTILVDEA